MDEWSRMERISSGYQKTGLTHERPCHADAVLEYWHLVDSNSTVASRNATNHGGMSFLSGGHGDLQQVN